MCLLSSALDNACRVFLSTDDVQLGLLNGFQRVVMTVARIQKLLLSCIELRYDGLLTVTVNGE